jgi:3-deoxy-D-manno-octulosonic-acid transferase
VGECLSILALTQALQRRYPDHHVLLTTGTRSAALMVERLFPKTVIHQYAPLDHPLGVKRFLNFWLPQAVLWVESDFWPLTLREIQRRHIRLISINTRISKRSLKRWMLLKPVFTFLLKHFDALFVQTHSLKQALEKLGLTKVFSLGNLKFAASPLPVSQEDLKHWKKAVGSRPVWVATSTHPGEEAQVLDVHKALVHELPELLTVIVPRHPDRTPELEILCKAQGMSSLLYQDGPKALEAKHQVILGDAFGLLGLFYRLCPVAFVGGSWVPWGGHNVIEPAKCGTVVCHGPHMDNFEEVCEAFDQHQALIRVEKTVDMVAVLKNLLTNVESRIPYQEGLRRTLDDQEDALNRLMEHLPVVLEGKGDA